MYIEPHSTHYTVPHRSTHKGKRKIELTNPLLIAEIDSIYTFLYNISIFTSSHIIVICVLFDCERPRTTNSFCGFCADKWWNEMELNEHTYTYARTKYCHRFLLPTRSTTHLALSTQFLVVALASVSHILSHFIYIYAWKHVCHIILPFYASRIF